MQSKGNPCTLLVEKLISTVIMESSMEEPQEIENRTIPLLGVYILRKYQSIEETCSIHNSQEMQIP
jgi:hypothetical protein